MMCLMTLMLELQSANVAARSLLGKSFRSTHAVTGDTNKPSVALQLKRYHLQDQGIRSSK